MEWLKSAVDYGIIGLLVALSVVAVSMLVLLTIVLPRYQDSPRQLSGVARLLRWPDLSMSAHWTAWPFTPIGRPDMPGCTIPVLLI